MNKNKEKEMKGQEQPKLTVRKDPRHLQDVPTKENSNKQSKRTEKVQKKKENESRTDQTYHLQRLKTSSRSIHSESFPVPKIKRNITSNELLI